MGCYFNLTTSTSPLPPRHLNLATSTLATLTSPLQPRHFHLATSTLATSTSPLPPHHFNLATSTSPLQPRHFHLATSTSPLEPRHFNPCYFNLATSTSPLPPCHFNPCHFNLATSTSPLQPRHFNLATSTSPLQPRHFNLATSTLTTSTLATSTSPLLPHQLHIYFPPWRLAVSWSSKLASWGSPDLVSTNRWLLCRSVMECIETIEGLPDTVTAIILQYTPTRYHPLGEFLPPCVYGCGSHLLLSSMDCCVSGVSTYIAEPIQVHT